MATLSNINPFALIKKRLLSYLLGDYYGGLIKRIDHNLEVLEMTLRVSPELFQHDEYLAHKLIDNDRFFIGLIPLLTRSGYSFCPQNFKRVANNRRKAINQLLHENGFIDRYLDLLDDRLHPTPSKRLHWTSS